MSKENHTNYNSTNPETPAALQCPARQSNGTMSAAVKPLTTEEILVWFPIFGLPQNTEGTSAEKRVDYFL